MFEYLLILYLAGSIIGAACMLYVVLLIDEGVLTMESIFLVVLTAAFFWAAVFLIAFDFIAERSAKRLPKISLRVLPRSWF